MTEKQHFDNEYFEEIDSVAEANNYFLPVLKDMSTVVELKGAKVLDVGCGTGVFMSGLLTLGCTELYGVDGENDYLQRALDRGYKEIKTVKDLNNTPLPYESNTFDLVLCKDVFEHLLEPEYALKEIRRILVPKGRLLLHVPNHFTLTGRIRFLFTNNIDTYNFFPDSTRWSFPHIRFYEYFDFIKVLKRNGFKIEKEMSSHFRSVPILNRFKIFDGVSKRVADKNPNNYAGGFTVFGIKKLNIYSCNYKVYGSSNFMWREGDAP